MRLWFYPTLAVLALALLPGLAYCEETEKYYGPDYLKPGEVLQCLRDRQHVARTDKQLSDEKDGLESAGREISAEETRLHRKSDALESERIWLEGQNAKLASMQQHPQPGSRPLDDYLDKAVDYKQAHTDYENRVKAYNDAVLAHQRDISAHNAAVISLNARLADLQKQADAVDDRCTRKKTYADDLDAAKAALSSGDAVTGGK